MTKNIFFSRLVTSFLLLLFLATFTVSNAQVKRVLCNWNPAGQSTSQKVFPWSNYTNPDITSSSMNYSGLITTTDSRFNFFSTPTTPSIDIGSNPYLSFTINTGSNSIDLDRFVLQGFDGWGGQNSLRYSVDGFASHLGSVTKSNGYSLTSVNLSSLPNISGSVEFRLYFYGTTTNSTIWLSTGGTNSSSDFTPTDPYQGGSTLGLPIRYQWSSVSFWHTVPQPTITSFSPAAGSIGSTVVINGTNFTGATQVWFNNTLATITVNSSTQITATVPSGATTGTISVTSAGLIATSSSSFTILPPPTISSFTPSSGAIGSIITITGTNLTGATAVSFNGTNATDFTINSATQITARVPAGATTGTIAVSKAGATVTSSSTITIGGEVLLEYPFNNSLAPSIGSGVATITNPGTTTILGSNSLCTDTDWNSIVKTAAIPLASFNTNAFQFDLDFSLPSLPSTTSFLLNSSNSGRDFGVKVSSQGRLSVFYRTPTVGDVESQSTNVQLAINTNYNLSVQFMANTIRMKLNGTLVLVVDVADGLVIPNNPLFIFGDGYAARLPMSACIDNFRFIKDPLPFSIADQLVVTPNAFTSFEACANSPSAVQTFTISGTNLSNNTVSIRPPSSNYEISRNGTSFGSIALSISAIAGTLNPTTFYVRVKSSSTAAVLSPSLNNILNIEVGSSNPLYRKSYILQGNISALPTISGVQNMTVGGNTLQLTGSGTPDATTPWSSSNTAVATISSTGEVTAVAAGTTTISYTISNGCSATTTIKVIDCNQPFFNALSFDGTNDYVSLGDTLENLADVTAEAWVYWQGSTNAFSEIFTKDLVNSFSITSSNKLHANFGNGSSWDVGLNSVASIPLNTWTHVAVTRQSGTVNLFINGKQDPATTTMSLTGQNSSHRLIGAKSVSNTLVPNSTINGKIDEVRFWSTARTQAQIQASMNTELAGTESGLLAYFDFNQGVVEGNNSSLSLLINKSNNILNGTMGNFAKAGTSSNIVGSITNNFDISGNANACPNSSSQYSHPISGGTWTVSNGANATVNTSGLLTTAAAENIIVSYTYSLNGCSFTATKSVSVSIPSAPSATTAVNLCRGTTATELTASSTTGNTLQWYTAASGGTASTTAPTPSTASNGTTTYYVSQKNDLTGCESARIAITVIVASTAPIINTQPLASLERCQSLMFYPYNTIAADVAGGSTIQWYSNATNSSIGGTPVVNANNVSSYGNIISTLTFNNSPGTTYYYLVATGLNGCSTTSSISAVTVSPIAVAGSIGTTTPSICFGESATLTLSGHTGSVQWQQKVNSSTYNPIDGATSATFVTPPFTNTNTYRALVSSPSCNTLATNEVSVTVAPARLLNQGLGFDGVDDKVTISNSPRLPVGGTSGFTLEAWVYVDPTMTNHSGGIVSKIVWQSSPTADGSGLGYGLDIENGKARLILGRGVGTRAEAISGSTIPTGTWVHLAGTYNNSIARLYVNGVQDGYAVVSDAFWNNDSAPLTIGSWPLESKYFKGKIDEVRIWNTVRSAIQILHNKDKELIGNEAGLVANYDFNQGIPNGANAAITTILDKSSNALNGTLQNFSLSGTSSNWIASGAMILSETTINTNQAVTLTHTHSGGSWSSSNSSVLSVNTSTGEATPIADGTVTISYVFTLNGCTYTSTKLFTVVIPTAITSFTPISGAIGSTVVITGTGFTNATSVQFSGTNATSFTVNSATQITATVPSGATTGSIAVTAVGGTGTSSSNFIIIQALAPPSISFASATQTAVVNRAISIATINSGGAATFTIAPALPTGVALNSSTGLISGTPTAIMASRSYTVTATNAAGSSSATFTFFIDSDLDGDGIGDATDPDIDGDGVPNTVELQEGTSPTNRNDVKDTDGDGVPDYIETQQGTNPNLSGDVLDTDGDGVPDYSEAQQGTNPNNPNDARDTDGDGVPDYTETQQGTDPSVPRDVKDTDGDGIPDYIESQQGTNPNIPGDQLTDSDGDGVPNYIETLQGTNPNTPGDQLIDSDGDGVPDYVEIQQGTNPTNPNDARDSDGDGVPNYIEIQQGTNPSNPNDVKDTDGDGIPDYIELQQGTNPNIPGDQLTDSDGDGVPNYIETLQGTNPTVPGDQVIDTDSDGVPDYIEVQQGTNPTNPGDFKDTDGDGVPNYIEVQQGTNPSNPNDVKDTDGDGIPDYIESQQGTNPSLTGDAVDTDSDGIPDYIEEQQGTSPSNPSDYKDSDGDGVSDYVEVQQGTNPANSNDVKDTDGDGVPDFIEAQQSTNPNVPGDQLVDSDGDGVPNYIETLQGTNPTVPGDQVIDTDSDGVPDYIEVQQGTNPTNPGDFKDTDGDGVPNYIEVQQGTNPANPDDVKDTDGDGIGDFIEVQQGTNPTVPGDQLIDSDGDGVPNYVEIQQGTNPNAPGDQLIDSDGDGVPNYVEIQQGTNPNNPNDARDSDGDGVPNYIEIQQGTNPSNPNDAKDTDGDGIPDYIETQQGTNPTVPGDQLIDSDDDGVPNYIEELQGTNPNTPGDRLIDSDGDGVPNYVEIQQGTNPNNPNDARDSDGDGVPNYIEIQQGTNPSNPNDLKDTDGDGIPDYIEVQQGTNPNVPGDQLLDSDGDGVPNYIEELQGTNPNVPGDELIDSDGDGVPDYVEVQQGTQPGSPGDALDTDGDGVPDYIEIQQGSNPSNPIDSIDTDGDGIPDYIEEQQGTNPNIPGDAKDNDGDGVPDYIEFLQGTNPNAPGDQLVDTDGDGVPDYIEIRQGTNPNVPNIQVVDTDGDGILDAVDTDDDGDTIPDLYDAFPLDKNEWKDTDGDGIGDNADTDDDNDGILDVCDVDVNGDRIPDNATDRDGDGIIDSCDPDRDGDGVNNTSDNCPDLPNTDQADRDRDGLGDVCDTIELNIMEGLTPNGDGINDTWVIYNIENHPGSIVRVYNTNGKQVFYSANYKNDWNGNYQGSSEMLPVGSYMFQIDLDGDGTIDSQGWMYISK